MLANLGREHIQHERLQVALLEKVNLLEETMALQKLLREQQ